MSREDHWNQICGTSAATEVSWFQAEPTQALALIEAAGLALDAPVIDVGAVPVFLSYPKPHWRRPLEAALAAVYR